MYLYQLNLSLAEINAIVRALDGIDDKDAKSALAKATGLSVFAGHNEAAEVAGDAYRAMYKKDNMPVWELT